MSLADNEDVFGLTDRGRVRKANEDQYIIANCLKSILIQNASLSFYKEREGSLNQPHGQLLLVADGMGPKTEGQRASQIAADTVLRYIAHTMPWFNKLNKDMDQDLIEELKSALMQSDSWIEAEADNIPERQGMGSAITLAYILWPRAYVVHVGGSRLYLFREGRLYKITNDHTFGQKMVDEGKAEVSEISGLPVSTVLVNALGGGESKATKPEAHKMSLKPKDKLLLCTDGLTRNVSDDHIANILKTYHSAPKICRALVDAANKSGGEDNITVLVRIFREGEKQTKIMEEREPIAKQISSGGKGQASESAKPKIRQS